LLGSPLIAGPLIVTYQDLGMISNLKLKTSFSLIQCWFCISQFIHVPKALSAMRKPFTLYAIYRLGHSSLTTTQRYIEVNGDAKRRVVEM